MKRKGFTLIELLAVIVILAIIALIVTPTISKIIDNTKKEAFKQSVIGVIQSGEYYIAKHVLETNGLEITYPIEFTCNGTSCSHDEDNLAFQGATPKGGKIIVESRKEVIAEYITDGKYCASGTKLNLQIAKSCSDIDNTAPIISGSLEGKVIHLSITEEESGVKGYCVNTSDDSSTCNWIDNTNKSIDHELESAGTYYVFARDNKDNISNRLEFTAEADAFCAYEPGQTWDFAYTGNVQEWTVPNECSGLYKLEVWGAQGGNLPDNSSVGGKGGYSTGYIKLTKGKKIYIGVGGAGTNTYVSTGAVIAGGYNGGGNGKSQHSWRGAGGGGATHIAPVSGVLSNLDVWNSVYIVAGGGGGAMTVAQGSNGGYGGGTSGQTVQAYQDGQWVTANGGTQATGYEKGQGESCPNQQDRVSGGGGGGYYGGRTIYYPYPHFSAGAGGSGYIGGVPEVTVKGITYSPSTTSGINSGNGKAKITLIEY